MKSNRNKYINNLREMAYMSSDIDDDNDKVQDDESTSDKAEDKVEDKVVDNGLENIILRIQLKVKDMFAFQIKHKYHGVQGIIGISISVIAWITLFLFYSKYDATQKLFAICIGLWFTVFVPFSTLRRSFALLVMPMYQKPLEYNFCNEGIKVSQEGDEALLPWNAVIKVEETKSAIFVYSSPKNGYILPKEQYKDRVDEVKTYLKKCVDYNCVIKYRE